MKNEVGITVKKEDDMSEWYTQVIQKAEMADYTLVSGCIVYRPRSYAIWEKIVHAIDLRFKKSGIQNTYFPLFIPESLLIKEATHLEGFSPEVAWVTHTGNTKLNERLAIRPTSETIMYDSYKKWIRSYRDLPLRLNQWNNVVRWEFKHAVPFLRGREFLWQEGHTAFATKEEAEAERKEIINIYNEVMENYLAIPSIIGKKSEKEKFAGAEYTISLEQVLPNGKAIQGPDFHHDGQIFAKAFDITFTNQKEERDYVYQNTFGFTTRVIGIMLMIHSDDKGLVLPPKLAETHVGIVPIFAKDKEKVLEYANKLRDELQKNFLVKVDDRDEYSPGYKFNELELKGVPIRLEIGPKDIEKNQVVLVRRDTGEKEFVEMSKVETRVKELLNEIQNNLFTKAKQLLEQSVVTVETYDELKEAINNKKIVRALYRNKPGTDDEENIKAETGGAKVLNIELEPAKTSGKCVYSGEPAQYYTYFGKSY
ncbi:proline--tRNA ligase [Candidatus Woesearchaeota archaeon]|nr:proline--tRNA ligase [Candidatus Woesearchaeota archaeon]